MNKTLLLLLAAFAVSAGACRPRTLAPQAPNEASAAQGLTGGTLVYSQNFEGDSVPPEWKAQGSAWTIENGWLAVQGARNDALWLQQALPDSVRIEFLAKSLSPDGDIKFEVFGDGSTHESGYIGVFGGWRNSLNIIARLDEHGDDRLIGADGVRVEQGRAYAMAVVRNDAKVRWYVDGALFLELDDSAPLRGPGHAYFALNDWDVPLRFDDVRVYQLDTP